jgi:hypothetical protein
MPDDATVRGATRRLRVDVRDEESVRLWSIRFDVSPAELKRAVLKVGPFAADVERELHGSC